jgi:hypothetical protein
LNDLQAVLEACKDLDPLETEGYVIRDKNFSRVKVKSPRYVLLHQLKGSMTPKKILEAVRLGETSEVLAYFPEFGEEFLKTKSKYDALVSEVQAEYAKVAHIGDQKEFALAIKHLKYAGALFMLRKGVVRNVAESLIKMNIDTLMQLLGRF